MPPDAWAQRYAQAVRKSIADLKTLFDSFRCSRTMGLRRTKLRTMPPDVVAREYARAVREAQPPVRRRLKRQNRRKTGAAASQEPGQAGAAALSGVWPQPTNPLLQIDGPVARLLKGSPSPTQ